MLNFHEMHRADVTVGVMPVPIDEASRFGTLVTDRDNQVVRFEEKPPVPTSNLISMGIYVFEYELLLRRLQEDADDLSSDHDFGRNIIPRMVDIDRVYAYPFKGYWRDVGTVESYWEANMGLLREPADFDLYDSDWVIHTRSEERPPAKIADEASVRRSLISHGCTIHGTVERSVISPGVYVAEGAVVRDSIVMMDCTIGVNSVVDRCILDKEVIVGAGARLGVGEPRQNRRFPKHITGGITVVGKRAQIPGSAVIGRNCLVGSDVTERDFPQPGLTIPSGGTVEASAPERVAVVSS
jgi:glucose-1-phosphate adenylyltransferase